MKCLEHEAHRFSKYSENIFASILVLSEEFNENAKQITIYRKFFGIIWITNQLLTVLSIL